MGDEDKKKKAAAAKSNSEDWPKQFSGHIIYDKNGVQVLRAVGKDLPFEIVVKDGVKKIMPANTDPEKIDFENLPELNLKDYDANVKVLQGSGGGGEEEKKIDNKTRNDWNAYVKFLKEKGLQGNPELDKGDTGKKILEQYIKDHPDTSLTPDIVKPIQKDFANYRTYRLGQIDTGEIVMDKGVTKENFMSELSQLDNIAGSKTTLHQFPSDYMRYVDLQNNTDKTVNQGFATVPIK